MNINIDNTALEALKKHLEDNGNTAIRLMVKSFGWAGPNLGIALDEQREDDVIETIGNVTFVADRDEAYLFDNSKIIYESGIFGDKFKVLRAGASTRTC